MNYLAQQCEWSRKRAFFTACNFSIFAFHVCVNGRDVQNDCLYSASRNTKATQIDELLLLAQNSMSLGLHVAAVQTPKFSSKLGKVPWLCIVLLGPVRIYLCCLISSAAQKGRIKVILFQ